MKKHVINFIWVAVGVMIYNIIDYLLGMYFFSREDDYLRHHGILGFLIEIVVVYFIILIMRVLWKEFRK